MLDENSKIFAFSNFQLPSTPEGCFRLQNVTGPGPGEFDRPVRFDPAKLPDDLRPQKSGPAGRRPRQDVPGCRH